MELEDSKQAQISKQRAGPATGMGNMMWLLEQMVRLPLTAFVYTMEVLITSMRGIQQTTDQVIDVTVGGVPQNQGYTAKVGEGIAGEASIAIREGASTVSADLTKSQSQKEQSEMEERDIDLRGEDLKLLEYNIWFTKADLETFLDEDKEVIAYSTTLGDYQGTRTSRYLNELRRDAEDGNPARRSRKWRDNAYPPPEFRVDQAGTPDSDGEFFNGLPQDDVDEYVKVDVTLLGRRPRDEKDESDRLKDINKTLRGTLRVTQV